MRPTQYHMFKPKTDVDCCLSWVRLTVCGNKSLLDIGTVCYFIHSFFLIKLKPNGDDNVIYLYLKATLT